MKRDFFGKYNRFHHDVKKDKIHEWRDYTNYYSSSRNSYEEFTSDSEFEESDEEDMNDQSLHFRDDKEVGFVADSNSQLVIDVTDDVHAYQDVLITDHSNSDNTQ